MRILIILCFSERVHCTEHFAPKILKISPCVQNLWPYKNRNFGLFSNGEKKWLFRVIFRPKYQPNYNRCGQIEYYNFKRPPSSSIWAIKTFHTKLLANLASGQNSRKSHFDLVFFCYVSMIHGREGHIQGHISEKVSELQLSIFVVSLTARL